ncbi:MAG: hypothetical protein O7D29_03110 [Gemmatimonadetes bacterium]|nr:hypothetical protein [Gemmatimonadota bacterium]
MANIMGRKALTQCARVGRIAAFALGCTSILNGQSPIDTTDNLGVSFFTGISIDAFAAGDLRDYLNPEESGDTRERIVGGFDFEYRLLGDSDDSHRLWVFGETVHGVRSADVDCAANPDVPLCKGPFDPTDPSGRALAILRNATSLEGFLGLRWEFAKLQESTTNVARLYLKGQLGFLSIAERGGDLVDVHHAAIGAVIDGGNYDGSYLEVGYGKTEYFQQNPGQRLKIDVLLSFVVPGLSSIGAQPFAQINVDSDLSDGADSIQSYFGLDFRIDKLIR